MRISELYMNGGENATVIATVTLPYTRQDISKFASIHSDPPGIKTDIPAILYTEYGKGKVLWSALPVEYGTFGDYRNVFINIIKDFLGFESSISSDAPRDVEIITHKDGDDYLISAAVLTEDDAVRNIGSFQISVKSEREPIEIELLTKNKKIDYYII